jgi:hypothetical protein
MGKWEPLISESTFKKVQRIIEDNHQGYVIKKDIPERPLIAPYYSRTVVKNFVGMKLRRKRGNIINARSVRGYLLMSPHPQSLIRREGHMNFLLNA